MLINDLGFCPGCPPSGLDADHQKEYDKLSSLSGPDFDKEYMSQMVTDHTKALDAFTKEAKNSKDEKFQAAVIKGKTIGVDSTTLEANSISS